jgi:hypothetical protein
MWRAMGSLLVLRDQVNAIAPNRSTASDGLVGDAAHQATTSDHNPHYVAGVGNEMVTALDLTHDPAHGFDSYRFAEVLRQHRDPRIKYVISNGRLFSSYSTSSRPAWTWGTYSGTDPHTNHVHTSVLDAPISDTRSTWNLDGFEDDMTAAEFLAILRDPAVAAQMRAFPWQYVGGGLPNGASSTLSALTQIHIATAGSLAALNAKLGEILAAAQDDGDTTVVLPPDAIAALGEIKAAIEAVPTAEENAEAVADELHDRTAE